MIWYYIIAATIALCLGLVLMKCYKNFINEDLAITYNKVRVGQVISIWLLGGWFGAHNAFLGKKFLMWLQYLLIVAVLIISVEPLYSNGLDAELWKTSADVELWCICRLSAFAVVLWIGTLLFIPYWCYSVNYNYFRRDKYEEDISSGQNLDVEIFCNELEGRVNYDCNSTYQLITSSKNITRSTKIEKDGFFDKAASLFSGSSRETNQWRSLYEKLHNKYESILKNCQDLEDAANELQKHLDYAQYAAYRNLKLAKELISLCRSNKGKKDVITRDYINATKTISSVNSTPEQIMDMTSETFASIIGNGSEALSVYYDEAASRDEKIASVAVATVNIVSGFLNNYSANQRAKLQYAEAVREITGGLDTVMHNLLSTENKVLRYREKLESLNRANRAFVKYYAKLRDQIFGEELSFGSYLKIRYNAFKCRKDKQFQLDMQTLVSVCTEYKKIKESK